MHSFNVCIRVRGFLYEVKSHYVSQSIHHLPKTCGACMCSRVKRRAGSFKVTLARSRLQCGHQPFRGQRNMVTWQISAACGNYCCAFFEHEQHECRFWYVGMLRINLFSSAKFTWKFLKSNGNIKVKDLSFMVFAMLSACKPKRHENISTANICQIKKFKDQKHERSMPCNQSWT